MPGGYLEEADLAACWSGIAEGTFAGQRILVAGAAGCLGGAIAEALLWRRRQGLRVEVVVCGRRREELQRRYGGSGAEIATWDPGGGEPPPGGATMAVHAASPASPRHYLAAPVDTLLANANGVDALARALLPVHGRLLYLSSGEIYGSPVEADVPTPESYFAASDPLAPRACYTEAKRHGEALCLAYHRQHGLAAVIARPIHVFGPGLRPDDGRAVCDFTACALAGRPITMLSDGSARRSFCYLSDATRLHLQFLAHGRPGEAYNVGREDPEHTIAELAELVCREVGRVPIVTATAGHVAGSPQRSRPCLAKARAEFAYQPTVDLADGLRRLAASFRAGRHAG